MLSYITYDTSGNLTGAYLQDLLPEHKTFAILVDEPTRLNWTLYRANDARDGVELLSRTPVPMPEPSLSVPASVTRRQARQALLLAGLLAQVQIAIDAIPDPIQRGMLQIEWDDGQTFDRDRTTVLTIGAALGLDDAGLDQLFIHAAAL